MVLSINFIGEIITWKSKIYVGENGTELTPEQATMILKFLRKMENIHSGKLLEKNRNKNIGRNHNLFDFLRKQPFV